VKRITDFLKKLNRNQILLVIGFLASAGPDVATVSGWLSASGIPHVTGMVHAFGWLSTAIGGLALAWPRIRSLLALAGLATPPGAVAPWNPFSGAQPALITLLDGSAVVQVKPPTSGGMPSLFSVATNLADVPKQAAGAIPPSEAVTKDITPPKS
jgi:hypothetical protein